MAVNNNTISLNEKVYLRKLMKELRFKTTAFMLAKKEELKKGLDLVRKRSDYGTLQSYTKHTDYTSFNINTEAEELNITETPMHVFRLDETELLEFNEDLASDQAMKGSQLLREDLDGNFFSYHSDAETSLDPVKLVAWLPGTSNVVRTFSQARATLINSGVNGDNLTLVTDPHTVATIGENAFGNTYKVADDVYAKGYKGQFASMSTVESSLLSSTGELAMATNPTANDTVTVNNVVFTFVASPSDEWDVKIGANVAASISNLVAAINGWAGAGTEYIEFTNGNLHKRRKKLAGLTAVAGTGKITLNSKRGYRPTSSSLTAAADKWGAITVFNIIMVAKEAISLAVQKGINYRTKDVPNQLSTDHVTWMRYGLKVFKDGAERMLSVPIIVQDAEA